MEIKIFRSNICYRIFVYIFSNIHNFCVSFFDFDSFLSPNRSVSKFIIFYFKRCSFRNGKSFSVFGSRSNFYSSLARKTFSFTFYKDFEDFLPFFSLTTFHRSSIVFSRRNLGEKSEYRWLGSLT